MFYTVDFITKTVLIPSDPLHWKGEINAAKNHFKTLGYNIMTVDLQEDTVKVLKSMTPEVMREVLGTSLIEKAKDDVNNMEFTEGTLEAMDIIIEYLKTKE